MTPALVVLALAALAQDASETAGLRGTVVANGKPVANARVSVHVGYANGHWLVVDGFPVRSQIRESAGAVTDASGRFALAGAFKGEAYLRVDASGFAVHEDAPATFDLAKPALERTIELDAGGSIAGTVLENPGQSIGGLLVVASRGDGRFLEARTDARGEFQIAHAAAGGWLLRVCDARPDESSGVAQSWRSEAPMPVTCDVKVGETSRAEIDLRRRPKLAVRVTFGGVPSRWAATFQNKLGPPVLRNAKLDGSGSARFVGEAPGLHRLVVTGSLPSGAALRLEDELDLAPGPREWTLDAQLGRVVGIRLGHSSDRVRLEWQGAGKLRGSIQLTTDEHGYFRVQELPAGAWLVFDQHGLDETYAGAFEVEAGKQVEPRI